MFEWIHTMTMGQRRYFIGSQKAYLVSNSCNKVDGRRLVDYAIKWNNLKCGLRFFSSEHGFRHILVVLTCRVLPTECWCRRPPFLLTNCSRKCRHSWPLKIRHTFHLTYNRMHKCLFIASPLNSSYASHIQVRFVLFPVTKRHFMIALVGCTDTERFKLLPHD